jgi:multisubunit Na+/H+ antiporter MnhB subunit
MNLPEIDGLESGIDDSIFARRPVATGLAVGIVSLIPHFFLSPDMSLAFAAILLGVVAGVYFGFAVTRGNNLQQQIEFNVAFLFAIAALLGLGISPWFIPAAFLAHGLWDFAHHNQARLRLVSIPQWYIPWCVIIDGIVGFGLIVIWRLKGIL